MRNVWANVVEKWKYQFFFPVTLLCENHAVYDVVWKNNVQPDRQEMTLQGEHIFFPWLQTFVTRKQRGIQKYFFFEM